MWKLTIMDDEGKQTELPLSSGEYAVGRGEQNTVRLTDRNISRAHLMLRRNGGEGWVVEDLSSYNGCFVNGMRVSGTQPMCHGDLLQLGDYRLELCDEAVVVPAADAPQENTAIQTSSLLDRPDRLVVVTGDNAGTEYPLDGQRIVLGRAEDADICINHSSVSRTHAEIVNLGMGIYEIFDRGSSNGIRVNGIRFERRVIEDDDEIELGDVRLRFISRGRIFLPGSPPRSLMHMAMMPGMEGAGVRKSSGLGYMIAIGAALGLSAVLAVVAFGGSSTEPPSVEAVPADQAIMEEAFRLSNADKHDAAHAKLSELPPNSPLRTKKTVLSIGEAWAESMLERASTADTAQRRELLEQVIASEFVSATIRDRAKAAINQTDPTQAVGDPPIANDTDPRETSPAPPNTATTSGAKTSGGTASTAKGTPTSQPTSTGKKPATTATGKQPTGPVAPPGFDMGLYNRVASGRGSQADVARLKYMCQAIGGAPEYKTFRSQCLSICNSKLTPSGI